MSLTNKIIKSGISLGLCTILISCEKSPNHSDFFINSEEISVKLVDFNPPKHVYAIVNIDGENKEVYISKHCLGYEKIALPKIGKEVSITRENYLNGHFKYSIDYQTQRRQFCNMD